MENKKNKKIKIHNGKIITPEKIIDNGCIILSDGKIVGIEQGNHEIDACVEYDAKGNYIAPGFIDIHTHGAGGSDFMDCTVEDCLTIAKTHMKHGTTLLYPTTLASDNKELFDFLDVYDKVKNQQEGASLEDCT